MANRSIVSSHFVVLLMLTCELAIPFIWYPLIFVACFSVMGAIFFGFGRSRTVADPVSGMPERKALSAREFKSWAGRVSTSERYQTSYRRFLRDDRFGWGEKISALISRWAATRFYFALQMAIVLSVVTLVLEALAWTTAGHSLLVARPVRTGTLLGAVWGYGLGLWRLHALCGAPDPG